MSCTWTTQPAFRTRGFSELNCRCWVLRLKLLDRDQFSILFRLVKLRKPFLNEPQSAEGPVAGWHKASLLILSQGSAHNHVEKYCWCIVKLLFKMCLLFMTIGMNRFEGSLCRAPLCRTCVTLCTLMIEQTLSTSTSNGHGLLNLPSNGN